MKVTVDELRGSPQHRLAVSFKEHLAGTEAVKPVLADMVVCLDSCGVRLTGRARTLLKLSCHRCLRPYFQSLDIELDERFVYQSQEPAPRERELTRDDFVEPLPADGVLDISDVVYQAVTLATPTYCLCGEECPGPPVATQPGAPEAAEAAAAPGKPVDPRWQNLKTLLPNEETG
ncbi:MAG TPA: DUF177 domain-containing protein [Candidatus Obscuribacterales bacterium]